MSTDLQWHQWLCLSAEELRREGHEAKDARFNKIGHHRSLSAKWARSVGLWSLATSGEIMKAVGIDVVKYPVKRGAFDIFKFRHRLWTRPQFTRERAERKLDPGISKTRWTQCDMAIATHAMARRRMLTQGIDIIDGSTIEAVRVLYGILPVEVRLYYDVTEEVIRVNGFAKRDDWWRLDEDDRTALWNTVGPGGTPPVVSGLKQLGPVEEDDE